MIYVYNFYLGFALFDRDRASDEILLADCVIKAILAKLTRTIESRQR